MHGHQARTMVTEMNSVLMIFEAVEDPRTGSRTVHNLAEIITMCLLAVLSGCNRISEIHFLMENHLDRLERFLSLEHGLLSLSQLYKILAMIRPAALQQAFQLPQPSRRRDPTGQPCRPRPRGDRRQGAARCGSGAPTGRRRWPGSMRTRPWTAPRSGTSTSR